MPNFWQCVWKSVKAQQKIIVFNVFISKNPCPENSTTKVTLIYIYTPIRFKRDNLLQYISLMKSSANTFYFFTCILPDYVAHESLKEFWKNIYFENMRAGFHLRCQNSLRFVTPEMMHFQPWKKYFNQHYVLALDPIWILTY